MDLKDLILIEEKKGNLTIKNKGTSVNLNNVPSPTKERTIELESIAWGSLGNPTTSDIIPEGINAIHIKEVNCRNLEGPNGKANLYCIQIPRGDYKLAKDYATTNTANY